MSKQDYTPKRKWCIECTEEKLRLMASMVEDITRFIGGQPQLMNCLVMFPNGNKIGEYMREHVRPMMLPDLDGDCVGWNGKGASNKYVRKEVRKDMPRISQSLRPWLTNTTGTTFTRGHRSPARMAAS